MVKLKSLIFAGLVALGSLGGVLATSGETFAVTCPGGSLHAGKDKSSYAECNLETKEGEKNLAQRIADIINVVLGVLGLAAVIVIIIGGISFLTSQGDSAKVTKGKNTILYGVVGLIVALLAFAIVNFVLKGVFGDDTSAAGSGDKDSDDGSHSSLQIQLPS